MDVTNNVVTLRGTVETAEQKTEAEQIAKNTESVKSVNNQLKVGSATRARQRRSPRSRDRVEGIMLAPDTAPKPLTSSSCS